MTLLFSPVPSEGYSIFRELFEYVNKEICNALLGQNAKRSEYNGGPCVALARPFPRALVKSEQPFRPAEAYFGRPYS